jgi:hypothetical protein
MTNLLRKYSLILEGIDDSELFGNPATEAKAMGSTTIATAKDVRGIDIQVGDTVARPVSLYKAGSAELEIRQVTKIVDGRVYLDGAATPIKFPERLAVLGR